MTELQHSEFDETGKVLRRAGRLRIVSIAIASIVILFFEVFALPALETLVGTGWSRAIELCVIGTLLLLITLPFSRLLRRSVERLDYLRKVSHADAIRDSLTGLFNRRHFDMRLLEEFARAIRHKHPLSLILADIDHFKKINDELGHPAGDEALREVSQRMQSNFRKEDVVARVGGEEFAILLPETPIDAATRSADRLRQSLADEPLTFLDQPDLPARDVTLSCGVSAADDMDDSGVRMVRRADEALYHAKKFRNKVVCVRGDLEGERRKAEG